MLRSDLLKDKVVELWPEGFNFFVGPGGMDAIG